MTKINLIDFVFNNKIEPFHWGDSEVDILNIFPTWKTLFNEFRESGCPYFHIDNVEFYFDNDYYEGLSEIIIKVLNFDEEYLSEYFDIDWLRNKTKLKEVCAKLDQQNLSYQIENQEPFNAPVIMINEKIFIAFFNDYGEMNNDDSVLEKIYIQK